jgi:hypothetical protein
MILGQEKANNKKISEKYKEDTCALELFRVYAEG